MKKWHGFTLIEVLVALAIFATSALGVMRLVTQHISTMGYLEQKMFASFIADNQMARVRLGEFKLAGSREKEIQFANNNWYWKIERKKETQEGFRYNLVDITVKADKEDSKILASIRGYVE